MTRQTYFSCTIWNADGELIDKVSKLSVWEAVELAQEAQAKGRLAKVTPAVPEKIQAQTRARRKS